MLWRRVGLLGLVGLLTCAACGGAGKPALPSNRPRVSDFQPGDELLDLGQALVVSFDREMVGVDAVGPVLEQPPVKTKPPVPLRVHWQDRKTLVVGPEGEWKAGHRYELQLDAAAFPNLAEPHSFTFDARPLRLSTLTLPRYNAPRTPRFDAYFTLPVDPEQATDRCALVSDAGTRVSLRMATDQRPDPRTQERVRFTVEDALALKTHYLLDCSELTPIGGDAPFRAADKEDKSVGFTTHGVLELSHTFPEPKPALPPERAELCLELSTPVDNDQLARYVHVTPSPEGLEQGWYEGSCRRRQADEEDFEAEEYSARSDRKNSVLLAPRRHYRVTVDAELTDVFGQQLGRATSFEFDTADRIPGAWTVTGFGPVLERGRNEHAVGTLNLASLQLRCYELSPSELALYATPLLSWVEQAGMQNSDPEFEPERAPWEHLGATPRTQTQLLAANAAANVPRTMPLDLGASCGQGAGLAGKPGLFALELGGQATSSAPREFPFQGALPARLVANVTDLGVVAKRGTSTGLAWVTQLSNGHVVPKAAVELLDANGRAIAKAVTDQNGLARFARLPPPAAGEFFAVRMADDTAIVGSDYAWSEGLRSWQLGVRTADSEALRLFVHTDRGVYRPGERVYVHGLVRELSDLARARVPAQRAIGLVLTREGEVLAERSLSLNDFGSFATTFDLPAGAQPGDYTLQLETGPKREYFPIRVAEFRPMTFELSGELDKSEVLGPTPVQLELGARYLFGAPLSAADVRFTVERSATSFRAPGFDEFNFEDSSPALAGEEPLPESAEGLALEREDHTDAQGRATLKFTAESVRRPTRYTITAAVTDAANDRATRSLSLLAHSADRYVGTHLTRFVLSAGEPVEADVVLVDRDGKPLAGEAELELRQERWSCKDPLQSCTAQVFVLARQTLPVGADKPARVSFRTDGTEGITRGRIHVRASVRDAAGRIARASDSGYVWSQVGAGPYEDRVAAPLGADKRQYAIGDRATLALQSQLLPEHYLVTSERSDVLSASVHARDTGLPAVTLDAAAAPNVFVSVSGMTPRTAAGEAGRPRLVSGASELSVTGKSRALAVTIKLARENYQPHERVEGDIQITHLGQPIAAEVALAAVNESVLLLTGFETPDPKRVFHAPRGLGVNTYSNITRVVADPKQAAAVPETARIGTPGEDNNGGRPELRNDYVAAAYVAPQLRTDANGQLHFAFEAPTDLSAYRLMAVAAARDDRVGSADVRLRVSQPVSAHLVAPRFVSRGDSLQIGALVHDTTGERGPTDVQFRAEGLALAQDRGQVVADPSGQLLRTRATVQASATAFFEAELHKGSYADRVRHEFVVRRPLDTELRVLASARGPNTRAQLAWPAGLDPALSQLEISVDRAGLAGLAPMLSMVLNYPYGCTEQTSAALNAIAAAPELTRAILPELAKPEKLAARVEDGIELIRSARTSDGQFALYPGMLGRSWLTALVLETGLALRDRGYRVPEALTDGAARALSEWLEQLNPAKLSSAQLEEAAHATLLLIQAGSPPDTWLDSLLGQSARMGDDARAYTLRAAALDERPDAQRAPLRAALEQLTWLSNKRDPEAPFKSPERTSALALLALLQDGANSPAIDKLAHGLIERASDPAASLSTRDVADTLSALTTWVKRTQSGASKLKITLAGKTLWQGSIAGAEVIALTRNAGATTAGGEIAVEANGDVSVSIRRRDVSETAPKPAFSRGLTLDRRYLRPNSNDPATKLALGDIVEVELSLRTDRAVRMVAIADPLPAGLEPMDPGLNSDRLAGCTACSEQDNFDHLRRHDDRIEVFAEWLPPGTHRVRYMLRATTPGTFSAPGATATLMYMPELHARSSVGTVSVQ